MTSVAFRPISINFAHMLQQYCVSLNNYKRLPTREVKIGDLLLGNGHPIRIQTMTTTEAKIHTNLLRDLYAVLGEERDGAAVLRLHDNTMAPLIWLGALVMALGGFCSLLDRRLRVAVPTRARLPAGSKQA